MTQNITIGNVYNARFSNGPKCNIEPFKKLETTMLNVMGNFKYVLFYVFLRILANNGAEAFPINGK